MTKVSKKNAPLEAFKQFAKGVPQKVIAINFRVTEKTVSTWKRKYKWEEKLLAQTQTNITEAYLLVSENARQGVAFKTSTGQMPPDAGIKLDQALATIHQVLSDNYLI
ncbi:MAG: helix-turn-helix domain-containing protein [Adhaeribacter sp.]